MSKLRKAEIRAKASQVRNDLAALTAAYDQGWDEAVEAAEQAISGGGFRTIGDQRKAIRCLRKGQGV